MSTGSPTQLDLELRTREPQRGRALPSAFQATLPPSLVALKAPRDSEASDTKLVSVEGAPKPYACQLELVHSLLYSLGKRGALTLGMYCAGVTNIDQHQPGSSWSSRPAGEGRHRWRGSRCQ